MEHHSQVENSDSPEGEDFDCRSRSSSPADPLAPLSDYAAESSGSSWGSEDSLSYGSLPTQNVASPLSASASCINYEAGWQQRYIRLRDDMARYQRQTHQMRDLLQEKVSKTKDLCKVNDPFRGRES